LDVRRSASGVSARVDNSGLEIISAVGQMHGAVGVIISIVYLAAQIRNQNNESWGALPIVFISAS
jgi:hypothetical protein